MKEIVVTRNSLPVLRAGPGLLFLPIGAGFCVLGYKAVLDSTASVPLASFVALLVAIVFAYEFCCTVAHVRVKNGSIEIVRSLDRVVLAQNSILKARIFVLGPSRWIGVAISVNGRLLPVLLQCVVLDQSGAGGFRATVSAFREFFARPNGMAR